jgi:hypothetical protein
LCVKLPFFLRVILSFAMSAVADICEKLDAAMLEVSKTYKHGISDRVIDEVNKLRPTGADQEDRDACLRAWLKIEKVCLIKSH